MRTSEFVPDGLDGRILEVPRSNVRFPEEYRIKCDTRIHINHYITCLYEAR